MDYYVLIYRGAHERAEFVEAVEGKWLVYGLPMDFSIKKKMRLISAINTACAGKGSTRCRMKRIIPDKYGIIKTAVEILDKVHRDDLREARTSQTLCGFNSKKMLAAVLDGESFFSLLGTFTCRALRKIESQGNIPAALIVSEYGLDMFFPKRLKNIDQQIADSFGPQEKFTRYDFFSSCDEKKKYLKGFASLHKNLPSSGNKKMAEIRLLGQLFGRPRYAEHVVEEFCRSVINTLSK